MSRILLFSVLIPAFAIFGTGVEPDVKVEIDRHYEELLRKLALEQGSLKEEYIRRPTDKDIEKNAISKWLSEEYRVNAPLYLRLDKETLKPRLINNLPLGKYLGDHKDKYAIPSFSVEGAVAKAKEYLKLLEIELPVDCQLALVNYNDYPLCWEIRWKRFAGEYPYDEFVEPYAESVVVVFHETLGLQVFGWEIYSPTPKSLAVKISREQAVIRASKCVPAVMKTPFYQSARMPGFVARGLKDASLKIVAPNWLLDPKRAIWIREKPPKETRLCWVVTFTTADTRSYKTGESRLIPPEIIVYIDAATGEVVGANFS